MADDERAVYIADMIMAAVGGQLAERETIYGSAAVQAFLDDPSCMLLAASKSEGSIPGVFALNLGNGVPAAAGGGSKAGPQIVLVKTRPVSLNAGNIRLAVASMASPNPPSWPRPTYLVWKASTRVKGERG